LGELRDAIKTAVADLASRGYDVGVLKDAGSLAGPRFSLVVFASEEAVRFAEGPHCWTATLGDKRLKGDPTCFPPEAPVPVATPRLDQGAQARSRAAQPPSEARAP